MKIDKWIVTEAKNCDSYTIKIYHCPNCNEMVLNRVYNFCPTCGKALNGVINGAELGRAREDVSAATL